MWTKHWEFHTRHLNVVFETAPEDMEYDGDDDTIAPQIERGELAWFCARVRITDAWGHELAADVLGGCCYNSIEEFMTGHRDVDPMNRNCSIMRAARGQNVSICHYFPSMVSEAAHEARKALKRLKAIPVRDVAA